ncbi:hypothetical protein F5Y10DRAFT_268272 [Nemania abortiva]|nr:hypothetical protein F5Y10DRAFT_268272 [Nemania abortiva]
MTKLSTSNNQPFQSFKELPDMSAAGNSGQIVTVSVGQNGRIFQVHLGKIGPLAKLLQSPSLKSPPHIALPNDDPKNFNAVVNWIYGTPFPRVSKVCEHVDKTLSGSEKTKEAAATTKPGSLPLEDTYATQCMLLDVMMMAERWKWEQLYNAAIDAFREGERNLKRERPHPVHIKVIYKRTWRGSYVRQFMGDYAYSLAKENKDLSWYMREKFFENIPDFLEDMLERVDGKGRWQYPIHQVTRKDGEVRRETLAHEAPLDLSLTTYHVHGGKIRLDCERSEKGRCTQK